MLPWQLVEIKYFFIEFQLKFNFMSQIVLVLVLFNCNNHVPNQPSD